MIFYFLSVSPCIYIYISLFYLLHLFYVFCRKTVLLSNNHCEATIGQVAEAFRPTGMLCSVVVSVGTYLLGKKFKNTPKMVAPYICSVSSSLTLGALSSLFFDVYCIFLHVFVFFKQRHIR